ncbi:MAG: hypothetical protein K0R17_1364 [Rariglobus sp.]|jgi:hypothetical protein|nr:hypothetical protein [Rariglobus sp.]
MNKSVSQNGSLAASASQEDISQRARELWERYGRPQGRDTEIWLEAERQLLGVDSQVEGNGDTAVAARGFDEATSLGKPRTRLGKSTSTRKPATAAKPGDTEKLVVSSKSPAAKSGSTGAGAKPAPASRAKR